MRHVFDGEVSFLALQCQEITKCTSEFTLHRFPFLSSALKGTFVRFLVCAE